MAPDARKRWIVLGGLLLLSLGASLWLGNDGTDGADVVAPAKSNRASTRHKTAAPETLALEALRRPPPAGKPEDAFPAKSWYVPPPPPKALPPPPPAPPPLPFTYMGRMVEEGKTTVFLSKQDRSYAAKVGDTLDGAYRVEGIDAVGVTLTYLPLNMQQTLAIGSSR